MLRAAASRVAPALRAAASAPRAAAARAYSGIESQLSDKERAEEVCVK